MILVTKDTNLRMKAKSFGLTAQDYSTDKVESMDKLYTGKRLNFEGRLVEYDFGDLDELALAYVLSIHKSQGSEFPCVVIPLHTQHYLMLQRNLLYTGVTRGKKLVVLVGTKKALRLAVQRMDSGQRHSALRTRLQAFG